MTSALTINSNWKGSNKLLSNAFHTNKEKLKIDEAVSMIRNERDIELKAVLVTRGIRNLDFLNRNYEKISISQNTCSRICKYKFTK